MSGKIFLLQDDETLQEMEEQAYASEDRLQSLLAKYPDLLAGDQMDEATPRRWLFISREVGIPDEEEGSNRWSVDHLFLDQDGVPTLVEVKRSSDTRIRREVVGQMLDYAANAIVYWPVEDIRARFEAAESSLDKDANQSVADLIEVDSDDQEQVEAFWGQVKNNLLAGRVRLVFVADQIPAELRRIVEFLNEQMDPAEVLAVELKQFVGQGVRTLVPRVHGQTAEAQKKKGGGRRKSKQWDEASFFALLGEQVSGAEYQAAKNIHDRDWPAGTDIGWGTGWQVGSFQIRFEHDEEMFSLFDVQTRGIVQIYFHRYQKSPLAGTEFKLELLKRLNEIPGISIPDEAINGLPKISLSLLEDDDRLQIFFDVFDWAIEEIEQV